MDKNIKVKKIANIVTIRDVAEEAGVSISLVFFVLNATYALSLKAWSEIT